MPSIMTKNTCNIATNAAQLKELHERVHELFRRQPHGPEHHAACREFHQAYDELAFPGGLQAGLERLKHDDPIAVETAIRFLDVDPFFFRSGYIKQEILRRLKSASLSPAMRVELERLILRSLEQGGTREFMAYARLAGALESRSIVQTLRLKSDHPHPEIRRRALHVLHVIQSRSGENKRRVSAGMGIPGP